MNPPLPAARAAYDAGLRALIWMTTLAAVLIFVWVVMVYVIPPPSVLAPWTYPGTTLLTATNHGPIQLELRSAPGSIDAVARWYDGKQGAGNSDPAFMMSGGPIGGARRQMKISLPKPGATHGTVYGEITAGGVTVAILSGATESADTDLALIRLGPGFVNGRGGNQASPTLDALAYPAAKRGAGGASSGVSAFQFTAPDVPDRILAHYLEKFGAAPGAVLPPGKAIVTGQAQAENQLVRMADLTRKGAPSTTLLALTPTNLCLLHLSRETNANATRLILGVFNR